MDGPPSRGNTRTARISAFDVRYASISAVKADITKGSSGTGCDQMQQTASIAVGTLIAERHSRIRLIWGFFCQGGITPFPSSFVIPFFCSTCAASILSSRPHICIAVARSGGQGRRYFSAAEGLSLTDASTAAGC
jgi:hypothetical protein